MKLDLNFASRRYVNRRAVSKAYWIVATVLLCLLVWMLVQCMQTQNRITQSQSQLTALQLDEQELLGTESVALDSQRIADIRKEFERNQRLLDQDSFRWTALFDRMEQLLPTGVSIRGFKPDYDKRTLDIEGVAKKLPELQKFLDRLLETDEISATYLKRQASIEVNDIKGKKHPALSFTIILEGSF